MIRLRAGAVPIIHRQRGDENTGTLILDATCVPRNISIKQQLQYICRDRRYIDELLETKCGLTSKQTERLAVIDKVYEQQKYMYDNKEHSVAERIVSISQPYIRPIIRGKAASPVEFGAKMDISLDEKGLAG